MSSYLNWVVRMMTDTEMQMNAVERVVYYGNLPIEEMDPHSKKGEFIPKWLENARMLFLLFLYSIFLIVMAEFIV